MTRAVRRLFVLAFFVVAALALGAAATYAQGGATSSLSGTVTDTTGAVVPGASVTVKNMSTTAASEAVTNAEGQFTVPALNAGKYSVIVSLSGFKTVTVNDVTLNAGVPAGVTVKMEVGGVEEQVVVTGGSEIVATQSSTVSTTLTSKQIQSLPLTSRNALDFVVNLPGVNTPGTARNSTVNGLPQGSINMTLDGISIQDNFLKTSDGFFARVQPRLDAIEEVTVTSAANGADSGGQGAVNIRFVTKSGSNAFKGNAFYTLRHDALNANPFFTNRNLTDPVTGKAPKAEFRQYQPGFNAGGPIMIPGLFDGHDKAFFFFNYEDNRQPSKIARNRTILTPAAASGAIPTATTHGEPARARRGERPDVDARSRHRQAVRRHAVGQRAGHDRGPVGSHPSGGQVSGRQQQLHPVSARPRRLQHQQEPPADRVVQLQPRQLDAGHDQHRASRSFPASRTRAASSRPATRRRTRCARRSARTSSTRCVSARPAARRSSRPSLRRRCSAATVSATRAGST